MRFIGLYRENVAVEKILNIMLTKVMFLDEIKDKCLVGPLKICRNLKLTSQLFLSHHFSMAIISSDF
jgi:hypothetical protein